MTGYVEIVDGWDAVNRHVVMDWSRNGDSGWTAGAFQHRRDAVEFARAYAAEHGREMHMAEIISFPLGAREAA